MAKLNDGVPTKYTTPYGKKIIALNVSPEMEQRILEAAKRKCLTRQSYIMVAINEQLEKDETKE